MRTFRRYGILFLGLVALAACEFRRVDRIAPQNFDPAISFLQIPKSDFSTTDHYNLLISRNGETSTSVRIYRDDSSSSGKVLVGEMSPGETKLEDKQVQDHARYVYDVQSFDKDGRQVFQKSLTMRVLGDIDLPERDQIPPRLFFSKRLQLAAAAHTDGFRSTFVTEQLLLQDPSTVRINAYYLSVPSSYTGHKGPLTIVAQRASGTLDFEATHGRETQGFELYVPTSGITLNVAYDVNKINPYPDIPFETYIVSEINGVRKGMTQNGFVELSKMSQTYRAIERNGEAACIVSPLDGTVYLIRKNYSISPFSLLLAQLGSDGTIRVETVHQRIECIPMNGETNEDLRSFRNFLLAATELHRLMLQKGHRVRVNEAFLSGDFGRKTLFIQELAKNIEVFAAFLDEQKIDDFVIGTVKSDEDDKQIHDWRRRENSLVTSFQKDIKPEELIQRIKTRTLPISE